MRYVHEGSCTIMSHENLLTEIYEKEGESIEQLTNYTVFIDEVHLLYDLNFTFQQANKDSDALDMMMKDPNLKLVITAPTGWAGDPQNDYKFDEWEGIPENFHPSGFHTIKNHINNLYLETIMRGTCAIVEEWRNISVRQDPFPKNRHETSFVRWFRKSS